VPVEPVPSQVRPSSRKVFRVAEAKVDGSRVFVA